MKEIYSSMKEEILDTAKLLEKSYSNTTNAE